MREDVAAQRLAAVKIAAGLRPLCVDRAEQGGRIERDARAVAVLVHARDACVHRREVGGHDVARAEFDHEVAATAAAGARRKIRMVGDARDTDSFVRDWRGFVREPPGVLPRLSVGQRKRHVSVTGGRAHFAATGGGYDDVLATIDRVDGGRGVAAKRERG